MNKLFFLSVPIFSVLILVLFFTTIGNNQNITGFAVAEEMYEINTEVVLFLSSLERLNGDSLFYVILDDRESSMTIKEFISKAGGEIKDIYQGELFYTLNLSDFDIDNKVIKGNHTLISKVVDGEKILETKKDFEV